MRINKRSKTLFFIIFFASLQIAFGAILVSQNTHRIDQIKDLTLTSRPALPFKTLQDIKLLPAKHAAKHNTQNSHIKYADFDQ